MFEQTEQFIFEKIGMICISSRIIVCIYDVTNISLVIYHTYIHPTFSIHTEHLYCCIHLTLTAFTHHIHSITHHIHSFTHHIHSQSAAVTEFIVWRSFPFNVVLLKISVRKEPDYWIHLKWSSTVKYSANVAYVTCITPFPLVMINVLFTKQGQWIQI